MKWIVAAFSILCCTISAAAQDYPNRPVTMVVPFVAGGGAARAVGTGRLGRGERRVVRRAARRALRPRVGVERLRGRHADGAAARFAGPRNLALH